MLSAYVMYFIQLSSCNSLVLKGIRISKKNFKIGNIGIFNKKKSKPPIIITRFGGVREGAFSETNPK